MSKKDKGIPISPKHGLNPSMLLCPVCGKDDGIALMGKLKGDVEAPRQSLSPEPCDQCKAEIDGYKEKGIVLFVIRDEQQDHPNSTPWQFFHSLHVITEEAADRIFTGVDFSKRMAFIQLSVANRIGLGQTE